MALRIVAIFALLAGVAMLLFAVYGLSVGHGFAKNLASWQQSQGGTLDPADFELRWKLLASVIGVVGLALLVSVTALWRGRHSGLLIISAAAFALAAYPWVLRGLGVGRYGFEAPDGVETVILVGIALASTFAFFRRSSMHAA